MSGNMLSVGGFAADHLRSYVQRVERLREEIAALQGDVRDVYAEAKANGFDVPAIKWLVSERSKNADDRSERDTIRQLYWDAFHGSTGTVCATRAPARETGEKAAQ